MLQPKYTQNNILNTTPTYNRHKNNTTKIHQKQQNTQKTMYSLITNKSKLPMETHGNQNYLNTRKNQYKYYKKLRKIINNKTWTN